MIANLRSRAACTTRRPKLRLSRVRHTSGLYARVERMTNDCGSFRPSTEVSRSTLSNGLAILPSSTSSSSAGSSRSIALVTSLTLRPAVSRIRRRVAAPDHLGCEFDGRDVDHAFAARAQQVERVVASADDAADERRLEFH